MDWRAALADLIAERRQRSGERPSTSQLLALRAGELSEEEREELLERAAWDPEVASELVDLVRFPAQSDDAEGLEHDSGFDRRWRAMRARLTAAGMLAAATAATPPSGQRGRSRISWLPLTASFVAGAGITIAIGVLHRDLGAGPAVEEVQVNLPIVELLPVSDAVGADVRRGGEVTTLPAGANGIVLTLAAPRLDLGSGPYRLDIRRADEVIFHTADLVPGEGGVFVLLLPRDRLAIGVQDLLLTDRTGRPLATFRLEVEGDR